MPGRLTPHDVVTTVRAHTPPGTIATVDAGAHMLVAMPLWPVDEPRRLLISSGLATMGFALPAAIAAALCGPGEPVIAFTGDGGLGMALMEIETAVRHRLRIVLVVFNDATLSLIKIKQLPAGQGGADNGRLPPGFVRAHRGGDGRGGRVGHRCRGARGGAGLRNLAVRGPRSSTRVSIQRGTPRSWT